MDKKIIVGITQGDINGISYEVIMKALRDERITELCTPVIYGSAKLVGYFKKVLNIDDFAYHHLPAGSIAKEGVCNLVNISDEEFKVDMGVGTEESGRAALMSLQAATNALKNGEIDVLVTAPINKKVIQSKDFQFPGHTEYLETVSDGGKSLMILFNDEMRIALVTTHMAVNEIASHITEENITEKIKLLNDILKQDFGIMRPKIAVLSLNPHAGDGGLLGEEEITAISPAIKHSFEEGILAFGPYPADGFFGAEQYRNYDAVLAMYHDQGLAPFKMKAGSTGVNFTGGLSFVRTSPDHGTGYDIAGKNMADATSMREAIYRAIDIYRTRRESIAAAANPLQKQYVERGADKKVDLTKEEPQD
jgi:4-hydroxythreonine-4-phosphate dehydrogenase